MAVRDHMKPGLGPRFMVKILTVDPATRKIEAALKDSGLIHVAVFDTPEVFIWPIEGEYWTVRKENGIWMLDKRVNARDEHKIDDINPGEAKIHADTITDLSGRSLIAIDNREVTEGQVIQYTNGAWSAETISSTSVVPHKSTHAIGGTDALAPEDIGASAIGHGHAISDITNLQIGLDSKQNLSEKNIAGGYPGINPTTRKIDIEWIPQIGISGINVLQNGVEINVPSNSKPVVYDIDTTELTFKISTGSDYYFVIGNDSRLSDARTPTGNAGGDLTGTYPNPTLATTTNTSGAGTYTKVTVNTKGLITSATSATKSDVGLENVDNTADENKPISVPQQTALDLKLAKASNLSDLGSVSSARSNLGLGNSAIKDVGPGSTEVAAGNHTHTTINNELSLNTHKLVDVDYPTNPTDAATKLYVDQASAGLKVHTAAQVATTGSETYTYTGSAGAGTLALNYITNTDHKIDGVAMSSSANGGTGHRILFKDADASNLAANGIYRVTSVVGNQINVTRSDDMKNTTHNDWLSDVKNAYVFIEQGSTLINTAWTTNVTTASTEAIGKTDIIFNKFSSVDIQAGDGLTKLGALISVNLTPSNSGLEFSSSQLKLSANQTGVITTLGNINTGTIGSGAITSTGAVVGTSLSAGSGAITTSGNISATGSGSISTSSGNIFSASGNIVATAGSVSGTSVAATSGNVTATGNISTTSGTVSAATVTASGNVNGTWNGSIISRAKGGLEVDLLTSGTLTANQATARGYLGLGNVSKQSAITFRTTQSFAVQGNIVTTSNSPLPTFFAMKGFDVPAGSTSTTTIDRLIYKIGSASTGGYVAFNITKNGTTIYQTDSNSSAVTNPVAYTTTSNVVPNSPGTFINQGGGFYPISDNSTFGFWQIFVNSSMLGVQTGDKVVISGTNATGVNSNIYNGTWTIDTPGSFGSIYGYRVPVNSTNPLATIVAGRTTTATSGTIVGYPTISISDYDEIGLNITGINGSPQNFSLTLVLKHVFTAG